MSEEEEVGPIHIPPEYRKLEVEEKKLSIKELWDLFIDGRMILESGFQRHYVWDKAKASRFIESILLDIPIPPIYLAESPNAALDIIDGHQRVETIFRFLRPILPRYTENWQTIRRLLPSKLVLSDCQVLHEINGKGVEGLSERDRGEFLDKKLGTILVKKESNPDMKFILFSRLNLGAMSLNWQELRNCMYHGSYNTLIKDLAENPDYMRMWRRKAPHKRMLDQEKVLRFFAFVHGLRDYHRPFQHFLNKEIEENQNASPETISEYRNEFTNALNWTSVIFGEKAFKIFKIGNENNPTGYWEKRHVPAIYDLEMMSFSAFNENLENIYSDLSEEDRDNFIIGIRKKLIELMVNPIFLETTGKGVTERFNVNRRFDLWLGTLKGALENPREIIEEVSKVINMLRESNVCSLCPFKIDEVEDATIVDIGGERVAHLFCKQRRS